MPTYKTEGKLDDIFAESGGRAQDTGATEGQAA
jgi:hypothetical protein